MSELEPLPASASRRPTDEGALDFETTADLVPLDQVLGQDRAVEAIQEHAKRRSVGVVQGPMGFARAPLREGEVMAPKELEALPATERAALEEAMEEVSTTLQETLEQLPGWQKELRDDLRDLERETARGAVGHLIAELERRWQEQAGVVEHLARVRDDLVQNARLFLSAEAGIVEAEQARADHEPPPLRRYAVHVLVTQPDGDGAQGGPEEVSRRAAPDRHDPD